MRRRRLEKKRGEAEVQQVRRGDFSKRIERQRAKCSNAVTCLFIKNFLNLDIKLELLRMSLFHIHRYIHTYLFHAKQKKFFSTNISLPFWIKTWTLPLSETLWEMDSPIFGALNASTLIHGLLVPLEHGLLIPLEHGLLIPLELRLLIHLKLGLIHTWNMDSLYPWNMECNTPRTWTAPPLEHGLLPSWSRDCSTPGPGAWNTQPMEHGLLHPWSIDWSTSGTWTTPPLELGLLHT